MNKSIIKELAKQLAHYSSINLSEFYSNVRCDCPGLSQEAQSRLNHMDAFPAQMELKRLVGELLQGSFENEAVNTWIVQQWGNIGRFDTTNNERITGFRDHLAEGHITAVEFDRISSLSKIASFVSRDRFFVFDSRVAFSLDGLLLKIKQEKPTLPIQFFHLPSAPGGRDERMRRTIKQQYPDADYYTKEETYAEYNSLILNLNKEKVLQKQLPPCWIEMLLFALGKTGGTIDQEVVPSRIRADVKAQKKRSNNEKREKKSAPRNKKNIETSKVTLLTNGSTIRSRRVLFGYSVPFEGKKYYLFVGQKPSFKYLELLTENKSELIEDCSLYNELRRDYLGDKEGIDFIYKRLKPYDEGEAKRLLAKILKRMTNGNKEESD